MIVMPGMAREDEGGVASAPSTHALHGLFDRWPVIYPRSNGSGAIMSAVNGTISDFHQGVLQGDGPANGPIALNQQDRPVIELQRFVSRSLLYQFYPSNNCTWSALEMCGRAWSDQARYSPVHYARISR